MTTISPKNNSGGKFKKSVMPKNNSFYIAPLVSETITQKQSDYNLVQKSQQKSPPAKHSPVKSSKPKYSPSKATYQTSPSENRYRNPDLEAKTAQIEAEFNRLLE